MLGFPLFTVRGNGLEVASQTMICPTFQPGLMGNMPAAIIALLQVTQNPFELPCAFAFGGLIFDIRNDHLPSIQED